LKGRQKPNPALIIYVMIVGAADICYFSRSRNARCS